MSRGGLGAASFQCFPCEPRAPGSSSPQPLERCLSSSLDKEVASHVMLPRLGQEKLIQDHLLSLPS